MTIKRDNFKCLDCGSDRMANFRVSGATRHIGLSSKERTRQPKIDYKTDYDMSKANEEFKKLLEHDNSEDKSKAKPSVELKGDSVNQVADALEKQLKMKEPAYDKSKSFFDKLSYQEIKTSAKKDRGQQRPLKYNSLHSFQPYRQPTFRGDFSPYKKPSFRGDFSPYKKPAFREDFSPYKKYRSPRNNKWTGETGDFFFNGMPFGFVDEVPSGVPYLDANGSYIPLSAQASYDLYGQRRWNR